MSPSSPERVDLPVRAIFLFGSLARGEASEGSDIDILIVDDGDVVRHATNRKVSAFNYPWATLLEGAASGDLFVCHLVFEAQALVDPEDRLSRLRASFSFKANYALEIAQATDLGWFLVRHGDALAAATVAKRMIWCVRTILIARSAEARTPVFSPAVLAKRTQSRAARDLLHQRHAKIANATMRKRLRLFLEKEVATEPFHRRASFDEFVRRFRDTHNKTALGTAEALRVAPAYSYPHR